MALRQEDVTDQERAALAARFGIAQDGFIPEDQEQRLGHQVTVRALIYDVAQALTQITAPSREQSLALTHLEEVLLWSGKAIFAA